LFGGLRRLCRSREPIPKEPDVQTQAHPLEPLADARTVSLTTFRRDGTPVATPVSLVVDGDRAVVRTYESSGKFKRLRNDARVEVAPSTVRGRPLGPTIPARARVIEGGEAERARRLIEAKHRVLHGLAVPLVHRLTGKRTVYLELRPDADAAVDGDGGRG
jgi:PPOX class probable F420-dependent enzyme